MAAEMHDAARVFISVGSNMGDKLQHCRDGIAALRAGGGTHWVAQSRFYRTAPVDYRDQDWFVNAVVAVVTRLDPDALLGRLQAIQQSAGRKRDTVRFGPRVLDLDILLYGDRIVERPGLVIPHPRMHKRRFVLQPFCDIAPSVVHPVLQLSMRALLERLDDPEQEVVEYSCD